MSPSLKDGRWKEALDWTRGVLERLKLTLNDKKTSNVAPWEEVCEKLNQKLRGWRAYFGCGSYNAQRAKHRFLGELAGTLRRYLMTPSQKVPHAIIDMSVHRTVRLCGSTPRADGGAFVSLRMKPVGKPDAGNPHVRFDERGWETGRRSGVSTRAQPRLYRRSVFTGTECRHECRHGRQIRHGSANRKRPRHGGIRKLVQIGAVRDAG